MKFNSEALSMRKRLKEKKRKNEAVLEELLTTEDVQKLFDVSYVTLFRWRTELGFPTVTIRSTKKDAVRFRKADVINWAFKHGKEIIRKDVGNTQVLSDNSV